MKGFASRSAAVVTLWLAALTAGAGAMAVGAGRKTAEPAAAAAASRGGPQRGQGPTWRADGPAYGVYDPARDFRDDRYVAIESFYFPWQGGDLDWLRQVDGYAADRNRLLMVTLEPFSWTAREQEAPRRLREDIVDGRYDATIDRICAVVGGMKSPVWIRWGHEMERANGRYPWAGWWPSNYVAAYRHVVERCRTSAPAAQFVWSPRGDRGMGRYFPGRDYVDIVGVSLYGLEGYQEATQGRALDFVDSFRPLYDRLAAFDLPVIIAEVGYSGSEDYVRRWSEQIMRPNLAFPLLKAAVYFNARETGSWPLGFGQPDWRVYANMTDGGGSDH